MLANTNISRIQCCLIIEIKPQKAWRLSNLPDLYKLRSLLATARTLRVHLVSGSSSFCDDVCLVPHYTITPFVWFIHWLWITTRLRSRIWLVSLKQPRCSQSSINRRYLTHLVDVHNQIWELPTLTLWGVFSLRWILKLMLHSNSTWKIGQSFKFGPCLSLYFVNHLRLSLKKLGQMY